MTRLDAEDLEKAMVAASTPHMHERDRRRVLSRLRSAAEGGLPKEPPATISEDPDKAREWFEAMGVKVI